MPNDDTTEPKGSLLKRLSSKLKPADATATAETATAEPATETATATAETATAETRPPDAATFVGFARTTGGSAGFVVTVRDGVVKARCVTDVGLRNVVGSDLHFTAHRVAKAAAVAKTFDWSAVPTRPMPTLASVIIGFGCNRGADGSWTAERVVVDGGLVLERAPLHQPGELAGALRYYLDKLPTLKGLDFETETAIFYLWNSAGVPEAYTGKPPSADEKRAAEVKIPLVCEHCHGTGRV